MTRHDHHTPTLHARCRWLLLLWLALLPPAGVATTFPLPPRGEDVIGELTAVRANRAETLLDVALRHDVGHEAIVAANPDIDPWLPQENAWITLPSQFILPDAPREGVVINLPEMRLYYYPKPQPGEQPVVITHPISIGSEGRDLPMGLSRIGEKKVKPSWVVPASIRVEHAREGEPLPAVVPPGPDNPLGEYAMRLGSSSYLIHGTNRPFSIGMRVSHGCIRMYPRDIETLFPQVPVGTPVRIINQPFKAGWRADELYVEAHKPLQEEHLAPPSSDGTAMVGAVISTSDIIIDEMDWAMIRLVAEQQQGIPTKILTSSTEESLLRSVAARATELAPGETWWLQLGAFRDYENARAGAERINRMSIDTSVSLVTDGRLCHLLLGPFRARDTALEMKKRLGQEGDIPGFPLSGADLNGYRYCRPPT